MTRKKLRRNLFIFFIVSLICYFMFELILSQSKIGYVKDFDSCDGMGDEILHHKNVPNARCFTKESKYREWFNISIDINSKGLRDYEYSYEKKKGTYRILMLGDSFTNGGFVNLPDTIPKQLEKKLNGTIKRIEVINAGVGSYSPVLEYLYLKKEGIKYNPDMIILNFDNSDVHDDSYYSSIAKFDTNNDVIAVPALDYSLFKKSERKAPLRARIFRVIGKYSYTFNFIKDYIIRPLLVKENSNTLYSKGDILVDRWAITRVEDQEIYGKEWNISKKHILKIKKLSDSMNATFVLTAYPYGHQVSGDEWDKGRTVELFDANKTYSLTSFDYLANFSRKNKINYIDLSDNFINFKESNPKIKLYHSIDPHFTKQGATVMAEGIYKYINENKLIK